MRYTHGSSQAARSIAVACALALALSLTGCDDDASGAVNAGEAHDVESSSAPVDESSAESTPEPDESTPSSSEPTTPPADFPADLPDGFPDIGVPFYSPSEQVAAMGEAGDVYVLEYVTHHELTIVNMFFDGAMTDHGWSNIDRSVEGQMTVTKATGHGYSLVIAVGPERTDDTKTSIHYTLRPQ